MFFSETQEVPFCFPATKIRNYLHTNHIKIKAFVYFLNTNAYKVKVRAGFSRLNAEKSTGVLCRDFCSGFHRDVINIGESRQHHRDVGWFVALAAIGHGSEIGCIGLGEQSLERHLSRQHLGQ